MLRIHEHILWNPCQLNATEFAITGASIAFIIVIYIYSSNQELGMMEILDVITNFSDMIYK